MGGRRGGGWGTLRAMRLELELAVRFLRRRREVLLRGTALAAFSGIVLATAALVVTLALMNGYRGAIVSGLATGNGHLIAFSGQPMSLGRAEALVPRVASVRGVACVEPVTYVSALAADPAHPASPLPVVLKATAAPPAFTGLSAWPAGSGAPPCVPGEVLARRLGAAPGTLIRLQLPPESGELSPPVLVLHVVRTFHLAFAEFDEEWISVPLEALLRVRPRLGVAGMEVFLDDPLAVDAVRPAVESALPGFLVTDWREMNAPLFAALRWQTWSLFVVLSLVVAVASFQVSSALVVLAIDKRRTTGMLQALGAGRRSVLLTLFLAGTLLGTVAVAAGLAGGVGLSLVLTAVRAVRFPPGLARIYMVESIPFRPAPVHLAAVAGVCVLLVLGASLWPAWRASRLDPVAALRAV